MPEVSPTRTLFRQFRDGTIVALFVDVPADTAGVFCECYDAYSGHGAADVAATVARTTPVEYSHLTPQASRKRLDDELASAGYLVHEVKRTPRDAITNRLRAIREATR